MSSKKLTRKFYSRTDTLVVARDLLGKLLVVPSAEGQRVSGVIVEVEAYMAPEDKASHAFGNRRTNRTEPMFGKGGVAYVYFVYGMHFQFNVVVNAEGTAHAVLVRALEPVEGIELMERRRGQSGRNLTNGPGKLCRAVGIDLSLNREDLTGNRIWLEETGRPLAESEISSGPRIGVDYAEEFVHVPWRFWLSGNDYVSKTRGRN
jgi:DNA-3-methyladenine glycosylase